MMARTRRTSRGARRRPALTLEAIAADLTRLKAAVALIASRAADLSESDGRILIDLLSPATAAHGDNDKGN